ncbi:hypothetical protein NXZ77_15415 [Lysinibacillus boronitolerans]|uniref:hypothetical protein n=1 Tax=Lysinibacillus boronitolerans TaxID=309788 RepID=UPI002161B063|nr:hypothetical protein [Lysinibacillus boronitolerans]MCS1392965.1 hypothetical protein [Lysinibacillus boronitolerans]
MNIIDLATKTMQTAIKAVVDGIKTTTDTTKTSVDNIQSNTNTMNSNINTLNANVGALLNGRVVKSVQRGTRIMTSHSGSTPVEALVTISPVAMNKSLVFASFDFPGGGASGQFFELSSLIEATNVLKFRMYMYSSGTTYTAQISWQVVEFY